MDRGIILTDFNGILYTVNCPYLLTPEEVTPLTVTLVEPKSKVIRCVKHKHKYKVYHSTTVGKCLWCALRHGYAHKVVPTKTA